MRHTLRDGFVVARQTVPADVNARRKDQPVVEKSGAIAERHHTPLRVDCRSVRDIEQNLIGGKFAVAEFLSLELAQSGDDAIAERARGKGRACLHQCHGNARVDPLDEASASCPCKAAAHHHRAPAGPLGDGRKRQHCRRGPRRCSLEKFTPARMHCTHGGLSPFARHTRPQWL